MSSCISSVSKRLIGKTRPWNIPGFCEKFLIKQTEPARNKGDGIVKLAPTIFAKGHHIKCRVPTSDLIQKIATVD